ncbi:hypothetical protein ANN_03160 [Periplaneta americana]|uniref:Ig-like domain-containing protein n=1 Tax=Periplaneta americana TaxID=6978 RepID=A0ABQ8TYE4_PERAM|nr:hypothetical protein ANN_03160 [Periplaneta americana]
MVAYVSWMRKRDLHILTSSIFTYTGDARFGVIHPEASDEWNLRVEYVQKRDAGIYECQVNTEPKINMAILLTVEGHRKKGRLRKSWRRCVVEEAKKEGKPFGVLGVLDRNMT